MDIQTGRIWNVGGLHAEAVCQYLAFVSLRLQTEEITMASQWREKTTKINKHNPLICSHSALLYFVFTHCEIKILCSIGRLIYQHATQMGFNVNFSSVCVKISAMTDIRKWSDVMYNDRGKFVFVLINRKCIKYALLPNNFVFNESFLRGDVSNVL